MQTKTIILVGKYFTELKQNRQIRKHAINGLEMSEF